MAWKNIYWFYVLLALLLVTGIIVALVLGLNATNNNNNKTNKSTNVTNTTPTTQETVVLGENKNEPTLTLPSPTVSEPDINLPFSITQSEESLISLQIETELPKVLPDIDVKVVKDTDTKLSTISTEETVIPILDTEKVVIFPVMDNKIWRLKSGMEIPRNISPSFGYSMSCFKDLILVGAPMDDTYGRIFGYNTSEIDGLKEVYDIPFSFVGSPYQRAGSALCYHIVAAPEFSVKVDRTKAQEGTLFIIDDLEGNSGNPTCRRLSTHLNDGFNMVKYGQIFTYQEPYVYVTKRKIGHQCVDIFEMTNNGLNLKFIQRIEDQDQVEDLFGHHIGVTKDNTQLVISDPFTNNFRIYTNQNQVWSLIQIINVAGEYEDKEDLEQALCLSEDGSKLIIGSADNEKVLVFIWEDSQYKKLQALTLPPKDLNVVGDIKIGFGTNVVLSSTGDMLAVCETGDGKKLHVFIWSKDLGKFDVREDILIDPYMPHIAMNSSVVWKGQDLFICGLSEVNHNGKLLWFQKDI